MWKKLRDWTRIGKGGRRKRREKKWKEPGLTGPSTAVSVAVALLTAVGVGSGTAARMLRNEPLLVIVLLAVMVLAAVATILAQSREKWGAAFIMFFIGVLGLTWLAGTTSQAKERPQILASFEITSTGLVRVTATVKADGLTTDELIYILSSGEQRTRVNPVTGKRLLGTGSVHSVIEEAAFGPNASGSVEAALGFEVSPALFQDVTITASRQRGEVSREIAKCIPSTNMAIEIPASGCVHFILPYPPIRPTVAASMNPGSDTAPRTVTLNVYAAGVPPSSVVVVKAWTGLGPPILEQEAGPDLAGSVKATITVPLSASASEVCAVAVLVPSATHLSGREVTKALCGGPSDLPETVGVAIVRGH